MVMTEELLNLKEKINQLKGKRINKEFDKWLVKQCIRHNLPEFYSDMIAELMCELEGLQVEKLMKGSRKLEHISFSSSYLNQIIIKIDKKIAELEKRKYEKNKSKK